MSQEQTKRDTQAHRAGGCPAHLAALLLLVLAGCQPTQEDRLLACLQEASGKYAVMSCQANFGEAAKCTPESPVSVELPELNVANLEWKWTQPYVGGTLDDGTPSQACLLAFDHYWERHAAERELDHEAAPGKDGAVSFDPWFATSDLETACYVEGVVLADCRYCDEFRQRDEEKRATLERRRLAASIEPPL